MKTTLIAFWSILYIAWSIFSLIEIYKEVFIKRTSIINLSDKTILWIVTHAVLFISGLLYYSINVICCN